MAVAFFCGATFFGRNTSEFPKYFAAIHLCEHLSGLNHVTGLGKRRFDQPIVRRDAESSFDRLDQTFAVDRVRPRQRQNQHACQSGGERTIDFDAMFVREHGTQSTPWPTALIKSNGCERFAEWFADAADKMMQVRNGCHFPAAQHCDCTDDFAIDRFQWGRDH